MVFEVRIVVPLGRRDGKMIGRGSGEVLGVGNTLFLDLSGCVVALW